MAAYQDPEEKCHLKWILEENNMDQEKNNSGSMEPEVVIWRLNNQFSFYGCMFLSNLMGQLGNDMLQLSAHCK